MKVKAKAKKPAALPKEPGLCADRLWELREGKRALEAQVAAVGAQIKTLEEHTLEVLHRAKLQSAKGYEGQCSIKVALVPSVTDWDVVYAWVLKHKAPELFERRVSVTAWRERLENKVVVPGIEGFQRVSLHVTRVAKEVA